MTPAELARRASRRAHDAAVAAVRLEESLNLLAAFLEAQEAVDGAAEKVAAIRAAIPPSVVEERRRRSLPLGGARRRDRIADPTPFEHDALTLEVRRVRLSRGWSQARLAEALCLPRLRVVRFERGFPLEHREDLGRRLLEFLRSQPAAGPPVRLFQV